MRESEQAEVFDAPAPPVDRRVKGGLARAAALSPEERKAIAQQGALARWHGDIPQATHAGELRIGDMVIPCSVVPNGDREATRVISEAGFAFALGRARSGSAWLAGANPGARMPHYAPPRSLISFIDADLAKELSEPLKYRAVKGGKIGYGVDARLIPGICEAWLKARTADALSPAQLKTADKAEILIRGLAQVGIIGLVDEATGYQDVRDRRALQEILNRYLSTKLADWAKRFPDEFYDELFRLRGWKWERKGSRRPVQAAKDTINLVYMRMLPDLLKELEARNPKDEHGRRRAYHHQHFSVDVGSPALDTHIHTVVTLMRAFDGYDEFRVRIDRALPVVTRLSDLPLFNQPRASIEPPRRAPQLPSARLAKAP